MYQDTVKNNIPLSSPVLAWRLILYLKTWANKNNVYMRFKLDTSKGFNCILGEWTL